MSNFEVSLLHVIIYCYYFTSYFTNTFLPL